MQRNEKLLTGAKTAPFMDLIVVTLTAFYVLNINSATKQGL